MTATTGRSSRAPVEVTAQRRHELNRRAQQLAWATVAYNTGEGLVAVLAGLTAGSVALVGFGLDSVVEVLSALAVSWQFNGRVDARDRERIALRLIAMAFFALAAYVGVDATRGLLSGGRADPSVVGIALAIASLLLMPLLVRAKRKVGHELVGQVVLAEREESRSLVIACSASRSGWIEGPRRTAALHQEHPRGHTVVRSQGARRQLWTHAHAPVGRRRRPAGWT